MRPSPDEIAQLWLYAYSRASLLEAMQWIDILAGRPDDQSPASRALASAIVVSYARLFTISQVTRSRRMIALQGVSPPAALAATHEMTIKLRNKVIGHKDALPAPGDAVTPNVVLVKRDPTGFDLHTVIIIGIAPTLLARLKALCEFFVTHCQAQLKPFIERYGEEIMKEPEGVHEIVSSEPPDPWIRPHRKA
jgi:hypothetical protein